MLVSPELIARFEELFQSSTTAHGMSVLTGVIRADGKKETISKWVKEPVTSEKFRAHLAGETGLGLCPILDEMDVNGFRTACHWAAGDIDVYQEFDHTRLVQRLAD